MNPIIKTFGLMAGSWNLYRTITSPKFQPMTGSGKAIFEKYQKDAPSLLYKEELTLHLPSESINASKDYIFRLIDNQISVFFNENPERFFYTLKFDDDHPTADRLFQQAGGEHLCGNDNYRASYSFFDDNTFELTYQVSGPKKDYTTITKYNRIIF